MVFDIGHTMNRPHAVDELLNLRLEHGTAQGNYTSSRLHLDRARMRHEATDACPHTRGHHVVYGRRLRNQRRQRSCSAPSPEPVRR